MGCFANGDDDKFHITGEITNLYCKIYTPTQDLLGGWTNLYKKETGPEEMNKSPSWETNNVSTSQRTYAHLTESGGFKSDSKLLSGFPFIVNGNPDNY
jgi:hypothetical protein